MQNAWASTARRGWTAGNRRARRLRAAIRPVASSPAGCRRGRGGCLGGRGRPGPPCPRRRWRAGAGLPAGRDRRAWAVGRARRPCCGVIGSAWPAYALVVCCSTPHPPGPSSHRSSPAPAPLLGVPHLIGNAARPRRYWARAAATESSSAVSSQDRGQNSCQSAAHETCSFTQVHADGDLAVAGLAQRAGVCRATHGDAVPSLANPVSSTTRASTGSLPAKPRATFPRTAV